MLFAMNKKQKKIMWVVAIVISCCSFIIGFSHPYFSWWDFSIRKTPGFILFVFIIPILIIGGLLFYRAK